MKSLALILVITLVSSINGSDHEGRGFRTKALRSHRKEHSGVLSSLGSGGEISFSGSGGDGVSGAGEQGAKLAGEGIAAIKDGGDQVKEQVDAAAKAFIDVFLQTFKEGIDDLKLALDNHYSTNNGNVKFNFKHSSENNNDGEWRRNTISCTSGLSSDAPLVDDEVEEDLFNLRSRSRSKPNIGVGSSGHGRFAFGSDRNEASASSTSSKSKFSFGADSPSNRDSESSGKAKSIFGTDNSGNRDSQSSSKAKFSIGNADRNSGSATGGKSTFSYDAEENSEFSERRGKIDPEFTAKSRIDDSSSAGTTGNSGFGLSIKSTGRGGNSGSYSTSDDSEDGATGSFGFGLSEKSSSDSDSGLGFGLSGKSFDDSATRAGFSFGSVTEEGGKGSAKFTLGSASGGASRFSLGRLRRGRPISRIDYAIQEERPWRDYVLKMPESPYTHSYGSQSLAPTYVNNPHN